jgi:ribosomal-protein-alanine N-acetyltransferase
MSSKQQPEIELRFLEAASASDYYGLYSHPLVNGGDSPFTPDETDIGFLRRIQSLCVRHFGIFLKAAPAKLIGDCALHHWNSETRSIEIGGALLPEYQGQGIMRAAFLELISLAKTELQARQIVGRTQAENSGAIRLVRGLGFIDSGSQSGDAVFTLNL